MARMVTRMFSLFAAFGILIDLDTVYLSFLAVNKNKAWAVLFSTNAKKSNIRCFLSLVTHMNVSKLGQHHFQ